MDESIKNKSEIVRNSLKIEYCFFSFCELCSFYEVCLNFNNPMHFDPSFQFKYETGELNFRINQTKPRKILIQSYPYNWFLRMFHQIHKTHTYMPI